MQRREEAGALHNKLEFPGGKLEANESAVEALIREIAEEVKQKIVEPQTHFLNAYHYDYPSTQVLLYTYLINKNFDSDHWFDLFDESYLAEIPEANLEIFRDIKNFLGKDEQKFREFEGAIWEK